MRVLISSPNQDLNIFKNSVFISKQFHGSLLKGHGGTENSAPSRDKCHSSMTASITSAPFGIDFAPMACILEIFAKINERYFKFHNEM